MRFFLERPVKSQGSGRGAEHLKDKDVTEDCREEYLPDITALMFI